MPRLMSGGAFAASVLGGGFDPVAALLSLSPQSLFIPKLQYLGPTETGLGAVAAGGTVGFLQNIGSTAANAVQATAGNRPIYQTSLGLHWLQSATNDFLVATRSISQPVERVSAWRILTLGGATDFIGGGGEGNFVALYVSADQTQIRIYAGTELTGHAVPATDVDFVATERHNGASSRIAVDNGAYVTGNVGAGNPTAMTLFAGTAGADQHIVARCYGIVEFSSLQTTEAIALARKAMAKLQGRLL